MHILCPHCLNPIEIVKLSAHEEIACPSCGSSFRLETTSTTGWEGLSGQKLGRFELMETVGHGAFGTVYKARDPELDRTVAVKVPRAGNLAGPQELDRFLIQARPVGRLERAVRWARRRPAAAALLGVSGVAALALVGLMVGLFYNARLSEALGEAQAARQGEQQQRKTAEAARDLAQTALQERDAALERAERLSYVHSIFLANVALKEDRVPLAQLRLKECKPELRNWEWRYLEAQCHAELISFPGNSFTLSPDGAWIATADGDGGGRVYDFRTGREVLALKGLKQRSAPVFSPDGSRLLAADAAEGGVRLFDVSTSTKGQQAGGQETLTLKVPKPLRSPVFSPDGTRLATGSDDGVVRVFDSRSGQEVLVLKGPKPLRSPVFSPDGALLALESGGDLFDGVVRVFDARTGQEVFTLKGPKPLGPAVFSPDGSRIAVWPATVHGDGMVRVFDARTGREGATLKGPVPLGFPVFSPDGSRVAVWPGSNKSDGVVRVFDVAMSTEGRQAGSTEGQQAGGQEVFTLKGLGQLRATQFSPDGARVVAAGEDGIVRVFDARWGQGPVALKGPARLGVLVFSPDGVRIAAWGGGVVRVFDARTGQETLTLKGPKPLFSPVFTPDGARLAAWSDDGVVRVLDTRTGQEVLVLNGPKPLKVLVFSPDGARLAMGSNDGVVRVFDVSISAEGRQAGSTKGQQAGGQEALALKGLAPLATPVFSRNGERIAAQGGDGAVRVFDARTGREVFTLKGPKPLGDPVFSPDGVQIAVGPLDDRGDGVLRVFDARTGEETLAVKLPWSQFAPVFSPDGSRLAKADGDGVVRVFDARSGQETLTLKGPAKGGAAFVRSAQFEVPVFSPDGSRIAVPPLPTHSDGVVRVYDARTGQEVFTLEGPASLGALVFSPDGSRIAVESPFPWGDGVVRVWTAPQDPAAWQAERRQGLADGVPAWHRARANESLSAGQWFAAAFHLGRLIEAGPATGLLHFLRGTALAQLARTAEADKEFEKALELKKNLPELTQAEAHAMLAHWDEAAKLYARAVQEPTAPPVVWYRYALLCLGADDRAGYSKACTTMVERFGKSPDPAIANQVAWSCALGPGALSDLNPAVESVRRATQAKPDDYSLRNSLGAVLYRAGQDPEAVKELNESIRLNPAGGTSIDFLFLAMAQHRLGKTEEARKRLDKAVAAHDKQAPATWTDRLEWQVLHREVESQLKVPSPEPKK
jgi:WD40 repeat protein/Flp pilus assembly protein TadD